MTGIYMVRCSRLRLLSSNGRNGVVSGRNCRSRGSARLSGWLALDPASFGSDHPAQFLRHLLILPGLVALFWGADLIWPLALAVAFAAAVEDSDDCMLAEAYAMNEADCTIVRVRPHEMMRVSGASALALGGAAWSARLLSGN